MKAVASTPKTSMDVTLSDAPLSKLLEAAANMVQGFEEKGWTVTDVGAWPSTDKRPNEAYISLERDAEEAHDV